VVRDDAGFAGGNGVCYALAARLRSVRLTSTMIAAVPTKIASALKRKAYYFVPLTVKPGGRGPDCGSLRM